MVVAVAKAMEEGHDTVLCASTGNTSASAAAYAAAAGLRSIVLVPDGAVTEGKLSQAMAYGARIVTVRGAFDQALAIARKLGDGYAVALVNSVNPHRIARAEDGGVRDRGRARRRARYALHPRGERREHHGLLAWIRGIPRRGTDGGRAAYDGIRGGGGGAHRLGVRSAGAADRGVGHTHRQPGVVAGRGGRAGRIGGRHRHGVGRGDHRRVQAVGEDGGYILASRPRRRPWRASSRPPGRARI